MADSGGGSAAAQDVKRLLASPLDAVDDLRTAAKWTLAAAGVVGAALISGGPLVAVGQVHGLRHALLAGLGLAVALIGVGIAIWSTSKVLAPRLTSRQTMMSPKLASLRRTSRRNPSSSWDSPQLASPSSSSTRMISGKSSPTSPITGIREE